MSPIRDGVEGIIAIPCGMVHSYLEWLPGRQGFVARHAQLPDDVKRSPAADGGRRETLVRLNGNVIQDTREFFLLIEGQPYMFPCYGTRHTFARRWQTHFQQFKHPKTGAVLPSFARKYRLTTVQASNALGRWFNVKFDDLGWVSDAEYRLAKELNTIVERGAMRVEMPTGEGGASQQNAA